MRRALFVTLVLVGGLALDLSAPPTVRGAQAGPKGRVVILADDAYRPLYVPPPGRGATMGAQSAAFSVDWMEGRTNYWGESCGTWPADARSAFLFALDIWAAQIHSTEAIALEVCWTPFGSGVLGMAGPSSYDLDFPGAPRADTWYPAALIDALVGYDWNDSDGWDSNGAGGDVDPEIEASFNSAFASWSFRTDGYTPPGQYDFTSVVLHEVCHGLGFTGSMDVNGTVGSWGWGTPYPIVFDHHLENGAGTSLLNTSQLPNPSVSLGNQLRGLGGGVYFDGPSANTANGGARVPLYAPFAWAPGSSIYHVDEAYDGSPNALMTKSISSGEAIHDIGPVTRGILRDIGWGVVTRPDLTVAAGVSGSPAPPPGSPVTLTLTVANAGVFGATGVVVTHTLPAGLVSPSFEASPSLGTPTVVGSTPYVWSLPDLAPGASGVITVYATLSAALPADYALWNTVTVSALDGDEDSFDNRDVVLLGGERTYVPLSTRNHP